LLDFGIYYRFGERMHFLLFYDVAPDYLERRGQFRDEHLRKAWESTPTRKLLAGGALTNPVDSAVLLFEAHSAAEVAEFARTDPYVLSGLVTAWRVREWTTVAGPLAAKPVHPTTGREDRA
jgi:uncharacterized protein YciI